MNIIYSIYILFYISLYTFIVYSFYIPVMRADDSKINLGPTIKQIVFSRVDNRIVVLN